MGLSNGKTNSVGDTCITSATRTSEQPIQLTLAERAGGDLDTVGHANLGVARGDRVKLAEVLEVVKRELEASEVEEDVLEGTTVPGVNNSSSFVIDNATHAWPFERTKRSRAIHLESLGL